MANTKKQSLVTELLDTLEKNNNFALVKFEKTAHTSLEGLRRELKKNDATLKVMKNTLLEKALSKLSSKKNELKNFQKKALPIKENTGLLALKADWNKGLGAFYQYTKKDSTLSFKAAILDNEVYLTDDLNRIATLPSRPELIAKVIGGMKSPSSKLVYAMKFNMQKLVYVLSEKSKKTE